MLKIINKNKCILMIFVIIIIFPSASSQIFQNRENKYLNVLKEINNFDLVIVSPEIFTEDILPLIEHKNNHNVKTFLKTTEEIYSDYNGNDNAEKVKYFIKDSLDRFNISYVLLIGGRQIGFFEKYYIPIRYVTVKGYTYPCDLYFADIYNENHSFQTWDPNNDGLYGDTDNIDYHPDISIGRWPCRTRYEVQSIVQKTIQYETNSYNNKKILLIGGDTFIDPDNTGYNEGELITSTSSNFLNDYEIKKLFSSQTIVSAQKIEESFEEGLSFVNFSGHGWNLYWSTYKHNKVFETIEPSIGNWDIHYFSNNQYPIIVFGGCHTAKFDISILDGIYKIKYYENSNLPDLLWLYPSYECISWSLTRIPNGGGIASLGYTTSCWGRAGEMGDLDGDGIEEADCIESGFGFLEINFFKAYGKQNITILGECWEYALNTYIKTLGLGNFADRSNLINIENFILLGDPSLKIGGYFNE